MYLWSGLLSPFSAKVRIYLAERQIDCDIREIPWNRRDLWGPKPAEFLAASPRGEVPVLVDGELAVFDSTLIWEYLEDKIQAAPLCPASAAGRTECRMWEDRADHAMTLHLTTLIRDVFLQADQDGADARVSGAVDALQTYYQALEAQLGKSSGDYLYGDYSVADIATYVCITFCQTLGAPIPETATQLSGWYTRLSQRPAVAAETNAILAGAAAA